MTTFHGHGLVLLRSRFRAFCKNSVAILWLRRLAASTILFVVRIACFAVLAWLVLVDEYDVIIFAKCSKTAFRPEKALFLQGLRCQKQAIAFAMACFPLDMTALYRLVVRRERAWLVTMLSFVACFWFTLRQLGIDYR